MDILSPDVETGQIIALRCPYLQGNCVGVDVRGDAVDGSGRSFSKRRVKFDARPSSSMMMGRGRTSPLHALDERHHGEGGDQHGGIDYEDGLSRYDAKGGAVVHS